MQILKEFVNIYVSFDKNFKIYYFEEFKIYISRNVKGIVGGKQVDKMWIDKSKLDKNLVNVSNEVEFS